VFTTVAHLTTRILLQSTGAQKTGHGVMTTTAVCHISRTTLPTLPAPVTGIGLTSPVRAKGITRNPPAKAKVNGYLRFRFYLSIAPGVSGPVPLPGSVVSLVITNASIPPTTLNHVVDAPPSAKERIVLPSTADGMLVACRATALFTPALVASGGPLMANLAPQSRNMRQFGISSANTITLVMDIIMITFSYLFLNCQSDEDT